MADNRGAPRPSLVARGPVNQPSNVVNSSGATGPVGTNRVENNQPSNVPVPTQNGPLQSGLELHVVDQTISTPQGPVTVEFTPSRQLGGIQLNPTSIKSNVTFSAPFSSTQNGISEQGTQNYTYSLSGKNLVPTLVSTQGNVTYTAPGTTTPVTIATIGNNGVTATGTPVDQPVYGTIQGKNTYLGTIEYTASVSNGNIGLGFSKFIPTNVSEGGSYNVGGQTIGYSVTGSTTFDPTTGKVGIDFPQFSGGGFLPPTNVTVPTSVGNNLSVPITYQVNFTSAGISSVPIGFNQGGKVVPTLFITQNANSSGLGSVTTQLSLSSAGVSTSRAYSTVSIGGVPVTEVFTPNPTGVGGTYSLSQSSASFKLGNVIETAQFSVNQATGGITTTPSAYTFANGQTSLVLTSASSSSLLSLSGLSALPGAGQTTTATIDNTGIITYTTITSASQGPTVNMKSLVTSTGNYLALTSAGYPSGAAKFIATLPPFYSSNTGNAQVSITQGSNAADLISPFAKGGAAKFGASIVSLITPRSTTFTATGGQIGGGTFTATGSETGLQAIVQRTVLPIAYGTATSVVGIGAQIIVGSAVAGGNVGYGLISPSASVSQRVTAVETIGSLGALILTGTALEGIVEEAGVGATLTRGLNLGSKGLVAGASNVVFSSGSSQISTGQDLSVSQKITAFEYGVAFAGGIEGVKAVGPRFVQASTTAEGYSYSGVGFKFGEGDTVAIIGKTTTPTSTSISLGTPSLPLEAFGVEGRNPVNPAVQSLDFSIITKSFNERISTTTNPDDLETLQLQKQMVVSGYEIARGLGSEKPILPKTLTVEVGSLSEEQNLAVTSTIKQYRSSLSNRLQGKDVLLYGSSSAKAQIQPEITGVEYLRGTEPVKPGDIDPHFESDVAGRGFRDLLVSNLNKVGGKGSPFAQSPKNEFVVQNAEGLKVADIKSPSAPKEPGDINPRDGPYKIYGLGENGPVKIEQVRLMSLGDTLKRKIGSATTLHFDNIEDTSPKLSVGNKKEGNKDVLDVIGLGRVQVGTALAKGKIGLATSGASAVNRFEQSALGLGIIKPEDIGTYTPRSSSAVPDETSPHPSASIFGSFASRSSPSLSRQPSSRSLSNSPSSSTSLSLSKSISPLVSSSIGSSPSASSRSASPSRSSLGSSPSISISNSLSVSGSPSLSPSPSLSVSTSPSPSRSLSPNLNPFGPIGLPSYFSRRPTTRTKKQKIRKGTPAQFGYVSDISSALTGRRAPKKTKGFYGAFGLFRPVIG